MNEQHQMMPFGIRFDLASGISDERKPIQRRLSQMRGMYSDDAALESLIAKEDSLVYEFYELDDIPPNSPNLLFGTSILYPGKVADEYFMTKGHFHTVLQAPEVYYCLRGTGYLVMETAEGKTYAERLEPGTAVYVPGYHAHRSVNTGGDPLVTFFTYPANAGHDYHTIETKGFRQLVIERGSRPTIVDNPRWRDRS